MSCRVATIWFSASLAMVHHQVGHRIPSQGLWFLSKFHRQDCFTCWWSRWWFTRWENWNMFLSYWPQPAWINMCYVPSSRYRDRCCIHCFQRQHGVLKRNSSVVLTVFKFATKGQDVNYNGGVDPSPIFTFL